MTKMGIKEFRERLSEVSRGTDIVEVTHHGKVVGTFMPKRKHDPVKAAQTLESIQRWHEDLRGRGIEPEDILKELGLDPWGVPLEFSDDR